MESIKREHGGKPQVVTARARCQFPYGCRFPRWKTQDMNNCEHVPSQRQQCLSFKLCSSLNRKVPAMVQW